MSVLLLIRPGEWEIPLFLHVLSAMVLVGAVLLAGTALVSVSRGGADGGEAGSDVRWLRLGYRSLLLAAIPAWIVMRASAQWVLEESVFEDDEAWIGVGFGTSEISFLLLIAATVLARMSVRRGEAGGRVRAAVVLCGIMLVLYLIAIFAMTVKPT